MGHRTIRDRQGLEWQIWDTTPAKQVSQTLEAGWLTFESPGEKRRLAPVPLYWLNATDEELLALLDRALPVRRKAGGLDAHVAPAAPHTSSVNPSVIPTPSSARERDLQT